MARVSTRPSEDLGAIDLLDLDRWANHGAPHDWFATLRRQAPVWWHPAPDGSHGFWVVSRYDDVVQLGRCPHVLSSDDELGGVSGLGPGDELDAALREIGAGSGLAKHLLAIDPPEHTTYRKLVNRGFTPRMIHRLEPMVRKTTVNILDQADLSGPWDLTTELAMPVPLNLIADLLGVPAEDHDRILDWSNRLVTDTDPEYRVGPDSRVTAGIEFVQYIFELKAEREANPTDDLVSALNQAEVDGNRLDPIRYNLFIVLLALAGNETTRNAISHGMLELARHPDQYRRLTEDPSLIPTAVEEILRFASPVLYFRRNAVADLTVAGQNIKAGDIVSLWYVSANRDEAVFDDPHRFDVGRQPNPHVAFGGGGPHFCLGASLARLEIRVVLEEVVRRYATIELAGPVERLRGNFLHGIKHLPVSFSTADPPARSPA